MSHLEPSQSQIRDDGHQRVAKNPALGENLFDQVLEPVNLQRAWKKVRSNKGKPGIDGITIEEFSAHLRPKWPDILASLKSGQYQPQAVRRVCI